LIKDDDGNNNNNNNNNAKIVLKKGRLVYLQNVLLDINRRNTSSWKREHPASRYLWAGDS
jgi:hypothetical protein